MLPAIFFQRYYCTLRRYYCQFYFLLHLHPLHAHIIDKVPLTDAEFELLQASFSLRRLKKNQVLLEPGKTCTADHFVLSGCLRQYYLDYSGKEHVVQFAFANWWISDWSSILSKQPSFYFIEALEPTEVLQVEQEQLQRLFKQLPVFETYFRMIFQQAYAAQQRHILWMQKPAVDRYRYFSSIYGYFETRLPQAQIASYLGLTRESFSRAKKALREEQQNRAGTEATQG